MGSWDSSSISETASAWYIPVYWDVQCLSENWCFYWSQHIFDYCWILMECSSELYKIDTGTLSLSALCCFVVVVMLSSSIAGVVQFRVLWNTAWHATNSMFKKRLLLMQTHQAIFILIVQSFALNCSNMYFIHLFVDV